MQKSSGGQKKHRAQTGIKRSGKGRRNAGNMFDVMMIPGIPQMTAAIAYRYFLFIVKLGQNVFISLFRSEYS